MPQLVKKRRSGWAVLAVGALIASIFAAGAGSVSAQPGSTITPANPNHDPDFGAEWSACVGAAGTHEAMFTDVSEDNVHADAINCIAHYGVTVGKGDGTYAPGDNVSAFQMRLFVQRAADRMGADGEAVLSSVMLSDTVTRLEMAQLMFGLVNDIDDDVRISPSDGQIEFYSDDANAWVVVDDFFADAKAQVPIADSQLIGATYEMGITRGTRGDGTLVSTPNSTFEPFANVTRAQMASFIARTMDHSNLRPAGLAIQRNSLSNTLVSYRDADFGPIEDARTDVFSALYPDDAFDVDDGECEGRFVKDETPSHDVCAIDIGDQLTDDEGNVEFTLLSDSDPISATCSTEGEDAVLKFETAAGSEGRTFWAWNGALGDEVDEDTDLSELEDVARPVGKAGPDYARVSGGLPTGDELAQMGETVTFTLQLYSEVRDRDDEDLVNDVAAGPDRTLNPYHLRIQKYFLASEGTTDSDFGDGDGETKAGTASSGAGLFAEAPGDWDYVQLDGMTEVLALNARPFQTPVDTVVFPNSDGEYSITLTHPDLNAAPAVNNTDVGVYFTLTPFLAANDLISANLLIDTVVNRNTRDASVELALGGYDVVTGYAVFSDDASDPHKVSGESAEYRIIGGRTGNSVTVEVLDQYGDGMRNVAISVSSNLDVIDRAATEPAADEVVYPEEVDITVQANENRNGDATSGQVTAVTRSSLTYATFVGVSLDEPVIRIAIEPRAILRVPDAIGEDDVEGTFKTRRNGAYRIGYTYIGSTAKTELITPESVEVKTAGFDAARTGVLAAAGTVTRAQEVGSMVSVYWAKTGNNGQSDTTAGGEPEAVPVLVRDVPSQTIVANESLAEPDSDNPMAYFYDEDDTFIVAGVGATFEMFEEALSATYRDNGIYVDYVSWENYVISRPGRVNRTIWELTLSCENPAMLRVSDDGNSWVDAN